MYILNVYIMYFIYNKIKLFIYKTSFVKKINDGICTFGGYQSL